MSMLSRSRMASAFSWWWGRPLCFWANLWISLTTASTSRSLWRSLFLMYQGALTLFLSTWFWNRCILSMLLGLVHPQSWIPYVQTGFRICLYIRSLLWRDSEEFVPISQYIFFVSYVYIMNYIFWLTMWLSSGIQNTKVKKIKMRKIKLYKCLEDQSKGVKWES
jgi:hypothetical protein